MSIDSFHHKELAENGTDPNDRGWRLILWFAFIMTAIMFVAEFMSGVTAKSSALQANSLDFFSDAVSFGLALGATSLAAIWKHRVTLFKGITLGIFAIVIILNTVWQIYTGVVPIAPLVGTVAILALFTNIVIALMLFRFRNKDVMMHSVWVATRNNVAGNLAVLLAAFGVFGTGSGYPDYAVAIIMSGLALLGSWQILRFAMKKPKLIEASIS